MAKITGLGRVDYVRFVNKIEKEKSNFHTNKPLYSFAYNEL